MYRSDGNRASENITGASMIERHFSHAGADPMKRLLSCLIFVLMACPGPAPAEPPPTNTEKSNNVDDLVKAFSDAADSSQQAEVARKIVALGDKAVISKLQTSLG